MDLERPGAYRTTFVGEMPVIVVRGEHGEIHAFENRCAHRGALIALDDGGTAKHFQCVYHAWSYDLRGNLLGIAFEKGIRGLGGMPRVLLQGRPRAAKAPDHDARRPRLREPVRRGARAR